MLSSKKELIFVAVIITISSLCSFYTGNLFYFRDSVNPIKEIKIIGSENILGSVPTRLNEKDFIFTSGYCYNIGRGFNHSDFYQGIMWYVLQDRPEHKILTISTVSQDYINKLDAEHLGRADFIICVPSNMTSTH